MVNVRLVFTEPRNSEQSVLDTTFQSASEALSYLSGYVGAMPMTVIEFEVEYQ
jgi:hypothetical protein